MAKLPMPDEVKELLRKPNPAVMATLRKDGHPVTVATWYLFEDDKILVNLDAGRVRLQHLRRDGRVSLTMLKQGAWYTHVSVQGKVIELVPDEGLADIDRLANHYTGNDYHNRKNARVSAWVEIESWHGWGAVPKS